MLIWLFQIHDPQPIKYFWVGLILCRAALCLVVGARQPGMLKPYLWLSAVVGVFQFSQPLVHHPRTPLIALTIAGLLATLSEMGAAAHDAQWRRLAALHSASMGLLVVVALYLSQPPPYPHYGHFAYYLRLGSTALYMTMLFMAIPFLWPIGRSALRLSILAVWMFAQWGIAAMLPRHWDFFHTGIAANGLQIGCLVSWCILDRKFQFNRL